MSQIGPAVKLVRIGALTFTAAVLSGSTPNATVPGVVGSEPCCTVLSVDHARGLVTALERESGNIFTFTVKARPQLAAFKPCRALTIDLAEARAGKAVAAHVDAGSGAQTRAVAPCCEIRSAPGQAGQVLGIQPHAKFEGLEIILLDVTRSEGNLVTASCLYCNNGAARVDLAADLRARGREAKLLDLANRVDHRVERTGGPGGDAMVSDHGPGLKLPPGEGVRTWMKFTAPAGNKVTLVVPGAAAPFENLQMTPK